MGRNLQTPWSPKQLFLVKNGNFFTYGCCGVRKTLQIFPLNVFGVPFRLIGIHFDHSKNKIQIFNFLPFPIGYNNNNNNNKQAFRRRISNRKETQCAEQVDKSSKQMYTRCRETT